MSAMDDLRAQVTRITTQDQAIIALCKGLSAQLKAANAAGDSAAIEELANQLAADADAVAADVAANTPPAPPAAA